ncbi:hypothetical protein BDZ94DRAFT_1172307 [Collybia nuda]|uniref:Uncharacterized protein n=1 Tax=Collybia nuda TaxID=64659 RepID=A0A9P5Y0T2_9AGAR|nr:hypothetical protein BDZ94DRAFT_1172307 [Collybia nuda]
MPEGIDFSLSTLSLNSTDSQNEDWDRSLSMDSETSSLSNSMNLPLQNITATPRNSVVFPADDGATPGRTRANTREGSGNIHAQGKRSLSELLRVHAEKGTETKFSQEEASRVADVLGQWINASSSPYEGEDDFFARPHDDLSIPSKRSPTAPSIEGRPRGQSESANSRPPSSVGYTKS